ncbi:sensor histidine kinase [Clostridium sp.]|uniref:sensor histidine kinase n=1 Tax=Clostridium sp. TaxID=1506 RepID=UPI003F39A944
MFKLLKRKLILINMTLLTLVFVGIFSIIYFMTASNMNRDIERDLSNMMMDFKPSMGKPKPRDGLSIKLDSNNKIIDGYTQLNIEDSEIENLVNRALENDSISDKIKTSDSTYIFLKESTTKGSKIVFLDVSKQKDLLINLLQTFLLLGSLNLLLLLFISIYLTKKSIKPIKDTFEKQKRFIADASHELKTPLSIIKTNSSVLLENSNDTIKNQIKWINYINDQTDRMSTLINEMLSLAKLDVDEANIKFSQIDISKAIEKIVLSFEAILFENDIELESNIKKNITISGDIENINKLFSILMDNAIKHTNKKGKITVELYEESNKVKLLVKNTGEGIKKEYLEKIFERFYRIDDSRARDTGGYGLGLSIAKSIVENHKGKIYARSIINESTTFIVELNSMT